MERFLLPLHQRTHLFLRDSAKRLLRAWCLHALQLGVEPLKRGRRNSLVDSWISGGPGRCQGSNKSEDAHPGIFLHVEPQFMEVDGSDDFSFFNMRWFFSLENLSMLMGLYIHQPCIKNHILGIIFFNVGELAHNMLCLGVLAKVLVGLHCKTVPFQMIQANPSTGKFQETTQPQQKVEHDFWMPLPIIAAKPPTRTKSRTPWNLLDLGLFQGWDHQPLQPALKNTNSTQADWPFLKTVEGEKSFAKAPLE